ncbi:MAG: hypothetical protein ACO4BZ_10915, partial [Ilumatobacteraceae bacterium]
GPARTSQRELSRRRSEIVATANLNQLINTDARLRELAGDARGLKASLAATMLTHGWGPTCRLVLDVVTE